MIFVIAMLKKRVYESFKLQVEKSLFGWKIIAHFSLLVASRILYDIDRQEM